MPINYVALSRYAEDYGITGEMRVRFIRFVSVIDFAYLEMQRAAAEANPPPKRNQEA